MLEAGGYEDQVVDWKDEKTGKKDIMDVDSVEAAEGGLMDDKNVESNMKINPPRDSLIRAKLSNKHIMARTEASNDVEETAHS